MQLNVPMRRTRHKVYSNRLESPLQDGSEPTVFESLGQYESKQKALQEQYKRQIIRDYQNKQSQKTRRKYAQQTVPEYVPQQRLENSQNRREKYREDLLKQIQDSEQNKRQQRKGAVSVSQDQDTYFPFGRPGAGAPLRDAEGNIIANRVSAVNQDVNRNFYESQSGLQ